MNDDPILYSENCQMQKFYVNYLIDKYVDLIKWQDRANVLDVGSADGTVALEVLLSKLPKDFNKFVLSDITERMLDYARSRNKDPRIDIVNMDITSAIPIEFREFFDHIFSTYCLNYIGEERWAQAMINIFDMLKPGGNIFFMVIVSSPFYDIYRNLAKYDKWATFMVNHEEVISPYHRLEKPEGSLRFFLESAGFDIQVCQHEEHRYTCSNLSDFLGYALSIVPFTGVIPKSQREDFIEDFIGEVRKSDMLTVEVGGDGREKVHMTYRMLVACASKPSNKM